MQYELNSRNHPYRYGIDDDPAEQLHAEMYLEMMQFGYLRD